MSGNEERSLGLGIMARESCFVTTGTGFQGLLFYNGFFFFFFIAETRDYETVRLPTFLCCFLLSHCCCLYVNMCYLLTLFVLYDKPSF